MKYQYKPLPKVGERRVEISPPLYRDLAVILDWIRKGNGGRLAPRRVFDAAHAIYAECGEELPQVKTKRRK